MRCSTGWIVLLVLQLVTCQILLCEARPHHGNDPYTPLIRFLKELRRARKDRSVLPTKDGGDSNRNSEVQATQDSGAIRVGVGGNDPTKAPNNGNFQLEQTLQQISAQVPTQGPYPIERVNSGLRTLLGGVNSFNLADILRGSFTFTRNENVRSVANTVIDSIFGAKDSGSGNSLPPVTTT